jgi:glycerophosphoryl diester phosphodiesterase
VLVERIRSGSVKIPTLREALDLTKKLNWLVNVELKSFPNRDPRLVDAVFEVITVTGTADRILISSFDHDDVALAAERNAGVATGVLTETPIHRPDRYVRDIVGADCYHVSRELLGSEAITYRRNPRFANLQIERISQLRDHDIPLLVYTVNDGLAVHLAEAGVSGVFSDDPGGVLKRFSRGSALP